MRATSPGDRARVGVGALLALLAIGLLRPVTTLADCAHPADRPAISLDAVAGLGDRAALILPTESNPAPRPCSGPQCSGKSAPAPATVAPPAPPAAEWALLGRDEPAALLATAYPRPEASPQRPIAFPATVFHPPRRSR